MPALRFDEPCEEVFNVCFFNRRQHPQPGADFVHGEAKRLRLRTTRGASALSASRELPDTEPPLCLLNPDIRSDFFRAKPRPLPRCRRASGI